MTIGTTVRRRDVVPVRDVVWRWSSLGWLSVTALWVATAIYAVTSLGLAGPEEPEPGGPVQPYVRSYLAYRRDLESWETVENWALAAALLGLATLVRVAAGTGRRPISRDLASTAIQVGALGAAVTQVVYLGALERALSASAVDVSDPLSHGTIVDVIGRADDYAENVGLLLVAGGVAAWSRVMSTERFPTSQVADLALSAGLLVVVVGSFLDSVVADLGLVAVGLVLAPFWLLLLARSLDAPASPVSGSSQ
jgi:hypothetical protein